MISLQMVLKGRAEMEAVSHAWAQHLRRLSYTTSPRLMRDPYDRFGDYVVGFFQDPDAAVEPPGYETWYVTGGQL